MKVVDRILAGSIEKAAKRFPCVVLTGPRRCGKTTLLRRAFPKAGYVLLEDPDVLARVRADPRGFLDALETPVILDEIQNAPELFAYVRTRVDAAPRKAGRFLLSGSQEAPLMQGVTESLAGRAAIFQLLPLSVVESAKVSPLAGGYPEPLRLGRQAAVWFRSYVQTYLERDVRAVTGVRDLTTFRRMLALLASRTGQMLNKTELAAPLGVSVPTITQWLSVLEITGQILIVPPYFESFAKRIVKSPKVYLVDSGLACHLLGIESARDLERSPFRGAIYEGFVAAELAKHQGNAGRRREIYWFRDQQGLEVDFLVPAKNGQVTLVEVKASRTVTPGDARPLQRLAEAAKASVSGAYVVHPKAPTVAGEVLAPGVKAVDVHELLRAL
jgi:predicted AAA+ superfamily ATPase